MPASGRCPECGRPFEPEDLGTYLGEGHTRIARRCASAPGWPIFILAAVYACLVLRGSFSPSGTFMAQIQALLVGLAVGALYVLRLLSALAARAALPRRRPPVVPFGVWRWLTPIGIAALAHVLVALQVPRAAALALDRSRLVALATGPEVQPSAWTPVEAWSGTVVRGAVWLDVDVWSFDPTASRDTAVDARGDPDEHGGPTGEPARDALARLLNGEQDVPGVVVSRIKRLAVLPIDGTGYGNFSNAAWAYAPGAPDQFGLAVLRGLPEHSHLRYASFVRHRGDWYRSVGWIAPLDDLSP